MNRCCMNCQKRFPACHDVCPERLAEKAKEEKTKKKMREETLGIRECYTARIASINKICKKKGITRSY